MIPIGIAPPPPPPSLKKPVPRTAVLPKVNSQKNRFRTIKKEMLENTSINLIHDPELRKQLPTDFNDILSLSSSLNVHALISPSCTLNSAQFKDIMTLTKGLESEMVTFNALCKRIEELFASTHGSSCVSSVEGESVDKALNELATQSEIVNLNAQKIKDLIQTLKSDLPSSSKVPKFKEPSCESGRKWYDDLKRVYNEESLDADQADLKVFSKWVLDYYKKPSYPSRLSTNSIVEYAVRTLGGPIHFASNLEKYQTKMLKENER